MIADKIKNARTILYNYTCFREVFQGGIEFGTPYLILDKLKEAKRTLSAIRRCIISSGM